MNSSSPPSSSAASVFAYHDWELVLGNAEASLSDAARLAAGSSQFDVGARLEALKQCFHRQDKNRGDCDSVCPAEAFEHPATWFDACGEKTATMCRVWQWVCASHAPQPLPCPYGHCVAMASAVRSYCSTNHHHHEWVRCPPHEPVPTTSSPTASSSATNSVNSSSSSESSSSKSSLDHSMSTRCSFREALASRRAGCRALLLSAIDDVHVQLLRPGVTGRRVHIGTPQERPVDTPSADAPVSLPKHKIANFTFPSIQAQATNVTNNSGVAEVGECPPRPLGCDELGSDSGEKDCYVWVDVVGDDWAAPCDPCVMWGDAGRRLSLSATDGFVAFRRRKENNSCKIQSIPTNCGINNDTSQQQGHPSVGLPTPDSPNDVALERSLLLRSIQKQRRYQSEIDTRTLASKSGVQHQSIEAILIQLEREYNIEIPLASIARRVLCRSSSSSTSSTSNRFVSMSSSGSIGSGPAGMSSRRIRQRIEEGLTMRYWNGSMFSDDDSTTDTTRDRPIIISADDADTSGAPQPTKEAAKGDGDSGSAAAATESHQHVIILTTGDAPISSKQAAQLLPPTGSEQRSDVLKSHHQQLGLILSACLESRNRSLQTNADAFSESWVMYIDTKERVVITIRPRDTSVEVGRIHTHFDEAFRYLPMEALVGSLIQASVLQYRGHVDFMYTIVDEVQRFLAPTAQSTMTTTRWSAASKRNEAEAALKRRSQRLNVSYNNNSAHWVVQTFWSLVAVVIRGARSAWRKIRRKKTRPRDITFAALRLLNLVNREAAVFHRCLAELQHVTASTRVALQLDSELHIPLHRQRSEVKRARSSFGLRPHDHQFSTDVPRQRAALSSSMLVRKTSQPQQDCSAKKRSGTASSCSSNTTDCCVEDYLHDTARIGEEIQERCVQLRHLSSELMSLAMALDAETYDENLAYLGMVTALFAPMSYWCTQMGVNFNNPTPPPFTFTYGYALTWACFLLFSWGFISWFLKGYHNVEVNRWIRQVVTRTWARMR